MAPDSQPPRPKVTPLSAGAYEEDSVRKNLQLPDPDGVETSVSTATLDRSLLMAATTPQPPTVLSTPGGGDSTSDADVMLRVKAGDEAAFDYLVQKYRRPLVSFMYRMAHNSAAAEDLAQEVFLRVYRSRASYEASAKFSTWLYRIATNLGVNFARDTRHERPENITNLDEADEETGQTPDLADKTPNVEEDILRRERLAAIREKVEALPERQKMAVLMHKYQQMDYRQI